MDNKPTAVFLCDGDQIFNVYDQKTREKLEETLTLAPVVITKETLEANRTTLSETEYIFSTWGMPHFTEAEIVKYLPNVKAVLYGAGTVQGFAREFLNKGVRVFSAWGANAIPVAEYTVAQIILAGKGFFQGLRIQEKQGRQACFNYNQSFPCNYNVKIGILGVGMIGSLVCEMLKSYNMEVLIFDPFASDEKIVSLGGIRAELETIFAECQTISCHIANLPTTVGMLNYAYFSKMKKNATFINTGRGAQVVESDLIQALKEEPDRTALLDVTLPEPPLEDSPFWSMQNVFLTPHIAGSMNNEVARMGAFMEQEFSHMLSGEPCQFEVSLEMLDTMA